jgi:hypothetical protein
MKHLTLAKNGSNEAFNASSHRFITLLLHRFIASSLYCFIASSLHHIIASFTFHFMLYRFITFSLHRFLASSLSRFIAFSLHCFIASSLHCFIASLLLCFIASLLLLPSFAHYFCPTNPRHGPPPSTSTPQATPLFPVSPSPDYCIPSLLLNPWIPMMGFCCSDKQFPTESITKIK